MVLVTLQLTAHFQSRWRLFSSSEKQRFIWHCVKSVRKALKVVYIQKVPRSGLNTCLCESEKLLGEKKEEMCH